MALDRASTEHTAPEAAAADARQPVEAADEGSSEGLSATGEREASEDISFDELQRLADEEESKYAERKLSETKPESRSQPSDSRPDAGGTKADDADDITFEELQALAAEEEAKYLALKLDRADTERPAEDVASPLDDEARDLDPGPQSNSSAPREAPSEMPRDKDVAEDARSIEGSGDSTVNDPGVEQGQDKSDQELGGILSMSSMDRSPDPTVVARDSDASVSTETSPSPEQPLSAKPVVDPSDANSVAPYTAEGPSEHSYDTSKIIRDHGDRDETEHGPPGESSHDTEVGNETDRESMDHRTSERRDDQDVGSPSLSREGVLPAESVDGARQPESELGGHPAADPTHNGTGPDAGEDTELASAASPGQAGFHDQLTLTSLHEPERPGEALGEVGPEVATQSSEVSTGREGDASPESSGIPRSPEKLVKGDEVPQPSESMPGKSDSNGPWTETEPLPRIDEFSESDDEKSRAERVGRSLARSFDDVKSQARSAADIVDKMFEPPPTGRPVTRADPPASLIRETPHSEVDGGNVLTGVMAGAIVVAEIVRRIGEKIKRSDKE